MKLTLVFFLADHQELVPMACISGILLRVSFSMVKRTQIVHVWRHNMLRAGLMVYTAVAVIMSDFCAGVLLAMLI